MLPTFLQFVCSSERPHDAQNCKQTARIGIVGTSLDWRCDYRTGEITTEGHGLLKLKVEQTRV